jgi:glucose-6-phosphate isomerase
MPADPRARFDRYRRLLSSNDALDLSLDVSCMDIPDAFFREMDGKARRALEEMAALEKGAIANADEKRMVGHYWLRAPELAPTPEIRREIETTLEKVKRFAAGVHSGGVRPEKATRFLNFLSIGIGGSALGPEFVSDALVSRADRMRAFFIDNTDPDGFDRVFDAIAASEGGEGFAATLVLVISKSGGTPEPRNAMLEAARAFGKAGLAFARHAVAITGEGSALDKTAVAEKWLLRFPMWDWVGGRTSELAAVGLVPAALQGIDVDALLAGARETDAATREREPMRNPAMLLALAWHHATNGRGEKAMVVLPYKDRLLLLSRYLQQLVMESIGKEKDRDGRVVHQGISVYGNKGSTDQHAYVQQLRDGVPNFFATFVAVKRDRQAGKPFDIEPGVTSGDYLHGFLLGTRRALHENGRPSLTITVGDMSARSVGQLIALFDRAVGFYGSLVNVNAYHQPGVEAGKKAAAAVIEIQKKAVKALRAAEGKPLTPESIAEAIGAPEEAETVHLVLERLAANPGRGVRREAAGARFSAG